MAVDWHREKVKVDLESGEFRGIWPSERNHCFKCSPVHSKVGQLSIQRILILPALQFMKILTEMTLARVYLLTALTPSVSPSAFASSLPQSAGWSSAHFLYGLQVFSGHGGQIQPAYGIYMNVSTMSMTSVHIENYGHACDQRRDTEKLCIHVCSPLVLTIG